MTKLKQSVTRIAGLYATIKNIETVELKKGNNYSVAIPARITYPECTPNEEQLAALRAVQVSSLWSLLLCQNSTRTVFADRNRLPGDP